MVVQDANNNAVPNDSVAFNVVSGPCSPSTIPASYNAANQDYEATITATRTAGPCTITATDTSASKTGSPATLTQSGTQIGAVSLSANPIPADGTTTTTASVQILDGSNSAVSSDTVQFTAGPPCNPGPFGAAYDPTHQTYTASISASGTAGNCTVTATDTTNPSLTSTAGLTQAGIKIGPVVLSTNPVPAGGAATAAVQIRDGSNLAVSTDAVEFTASAPCRPGPYPASYDPTAQWYTAKIAATTTPGNCTITAIDTTASPSLTNTATLAQTPATPSTVRLLLSRSTLVADGVSQTAATATVTDPFGNPVPNALVSFQSSGGQAIGGVQNDGNGSYTALVTSTRRAGNYTISVGVAGLSATSGLTQVNGPARNVGLRLSSPTLVADGISTTTATVTVTDANGNPVSGDRIQLSSTDPGVRFGPVTGQAGGVYTATVRSSNHPTSLTIIATDASVSPSVSGDATLTETPAPSLLERTTMQWSFNFHPRYTMVLSLLVNGAPGGAVVRVVCTGAGCPYGRHATAVRRHPICHRVGHHRRCTSAGNLNLGQAFAHRHLRVGTRLVVEITRVGWIGKYYSFKILPGRGPQVVINCLAPGGVKPGVGCT